MEDLLALKHYLSHSIKLDIPDHILNFIAQHTQYKKYSPGSIIFREGESGYFFCGLIRGKVRVEKQDSHNGVNHQLNSVNAPSLIGEIALLANQPRLATVIAADEVEVFEFDKAILDRDTPAGRQAYAYFYKAAAERNVNRLITTTESYTQSLSNQLALKNNILLFGDTFILILTYLGIWSVTLSLLQYFHYVQFIKSGVGNWVLVAAFLSGALLLMQRLFKHGYTLGDLGVTTNNIIRSGFQALGLAVIFIVMTLFLSYQYQIDVWQRIVDLWHIKSWFFFNYILHVYLQEFIARGVLLGTLLRFFGESRYHLAILASSILFTMTHTHKPAGVLLIIFSSSLLFGYLYNAQRNLIGVSILHYVMGIVAKSLYWI